MKTNEDSTIACQMIMDLWGLSRHVYRNMFRPFRLIDSIYLMHLDASSRHALPKTSMRSASSMFLADRLCLSNA